MFWRLEIIVQVTIAELYSQSRKNSVLYQMPMDLFTNGSRPKPK
jgi:hypothetical protein